MTFQVRLAATDEYLGTVKAKDIIHAAVVAAEKYGEEGLCRIVPMDELRATIAQWREDGKVVGRDR